jgi:amidase
MEELAKRSATQLVKAIKTKQISSVELVQYFMERYHRLNPKINAIVATDFDAALKRAQEADAALAGGEDWGPVHGLPMTLKDNYETTGIPTTFGSPDCGGRSVVGQCRSDYFRKNQPLPFC